MQNTFFIIVKGKPKGPFTLAELKELPITPDTFVKKELMDDYKEAQEIDEFIKELGFSSPTRTIQYYASFDQRLLACAIDYFLISIAIAFVSLIIIVSLNNHHQQLTVVLFAALSIFPIKLAYNILFESSSWQATLGKKTMNIQVVNTDGQRISFWTAFGRNVLKIVNVLSLGIGYLFCLFHSKKQGLHDYLAKTLVIKDRLI